MEHDDDKKPDDVWCVRCSAFIPENDNVILLDPDNLDSPVICTNCDKEIREMTANDKAVEEAMSKICVCGHSLFEHYGDMYCTAEIEGEKVDESHSVCACEQFVLVKEGKDDETL